MFKKLRNQVSLAVALVAFSAVIHLASHANAQTYGGWVYRSDLGGWLDSNTGLVWGKSCVEATGAVCYWSGANTYTSSVRTATGNSAWRLPTAAELEDAYQKGGPSVLLTRSQQSFFWSSQTQGKKYAWASDWTSRASGNRSGFYDQKSIGNAIPVYRAY